MRKTQNVSERFSDNPLSLRLAVVILALLVAVSAMSVPLLIANQSRFLTEDVRARYQVGSLANSDVRATETFHYIDESETKSRQATAADSILPQFHVSMVESAFMVALVDRLFEDRVVEGYAEVQESIASLDSDERTALHALLKESVRRYANEGIFVPEELNQAVRQGYDRIAVVSDSGTVEPFPVQEVPIDSLQTSATIANSVLRDVRRMSRMLGVNLEQLAISGLSLILRPNVFYAPLETAILREDAARAIEPVMIRVEKGQYILKKDYVISTNDLKALQAMRLAAVKYSPSQILGRVCFVLIVTVSSIYAMQLVFVHSHRKYQYMLLFLAGVLLTQMALYGTLTIVTGMGFITLDPFLPVFALPIIFALVTNRKRAGMIAAVLLGSYAILLPSSTSTTVFFVVAVSFSGIYFIRYVSKRIDMIFQWFFGIVSAACLVLFNNLYNGYGFGHILQSIVSMAGNISVTYVLVTILLPLIEWLWNVPTSFRLRELAFSDSPVLVRLSQNAVGTYNHSMIVGEMAYAAAQEIGADPLLARVGGIYHDIGKQEHPEYFIENQSGDNKHDDLKASLSVAIIKSHVKIGVEKGREARLPQEVLDIISQHHGNDVIAIFLKEAQMAAATEGNNAIVKQQDYSYHNQVPQSPEAAIVMLADSVEAASRTIRKPSAQRYEKLVNQIVMGKIERKQLVASRLSMTDLDTISKVFVQILTGRYHSRIEYPGESQEDET